MRSRRRRTPVSPGAPRSPGLQVLDPAQHVQVSGGVLLDHVLHVVRPQGLLEPLLVQEELHDPKTGEKQVWFLGWDRSQFIRSPSIHPSIHPPAGLLRVRRERRKL